DHHVAHVDGRLALGDAALDVALGVGPRVLLGEAHPLHDHPVLLRDDLEDLSLLARVPARDHLDDVVLAQADARADGGGVGGHGYRTSGAREMIFMNFLSRSSRATGPKTRVPTGSPASLMSTAAFLSKRR